MNFFYFVDHFWISLKWRFDPQHCHLLQEWKRKGFWVKRSCQYANASYKVGNNDTKGRRDESISMWEKHSPLLQWGSQDKHCMFHPQTTSNKIKTMHLSNILAVWWQTNLGVWSWRVLTTKYIICWVNAYFCCFKRAFLFGNIYQAKVVMNISAFVRR